jgi:two-component system, chemotaxis family, chemotaxis protein CheY
LRLLIVEDNPEMRRLLKRLVADLAAEVAECDDGSGALEAYRDCQPDWVLMDIEMKGTDGITATRQIRAVFPDAKVIFVTNHDTQSLRQAAQQLGACGYIVKEDLLEVRRRLATQD